MRNQRIVHVDLVRPGVEYTAMEPNIKRGAHRIRKDNVTYVILSIKGLMDLEPHEWLVDDYGPGHLDATRKELEELQPAQMQRISDGGGAVHDINQT